jgi:hypothetical protein
MEKDEMRELIATEVRNMIKVACNAAINVPVQPHEIQSAMSPEGLMATEAQKQEATKLVASIMSAVDDYVREAQARVVEKTDPQRAQNIRNFKPTF